MYFLLLLGIELGILGFTILAHSANQALALNPGGVD
jgi:hypothetical protein